MTQEEQAYFVTELCDSIRDNMLKRIRAGEIPKELDGLELRLWLAEVAAGNAIFMNDQSRKRKATFKHWHRQLP